MVKLNLGLTSDKFSRALDLELVILNETRCVCETQIPPATTIFSKTVTLIFDLDLDR